MASDDDLLPKVGEDTLPASGDEVIREVERLRRAPAKFRCCGMSLGLFLAVLIVAWLLWRFVIP